jgi:hypothetical protein
MNFEALPNKKRVPLVPISGIGFCTLMYLGVRDISDSDPGKMYKYYVFISLFAVVLYFTVIAAWDYLRALFDPNAKLIIGEKGITDNLSIMSCGNVEWSEITGSEVKNVFNKSFLVVHVKDPYKIISAHTKWRQRPLKALLKRFGSPVVISQNRVARTIEEIRSNISKYTS